MIFRVFRPHLSQHRFRIPGRWGHNAMGVFMAMVVVVCQNIGLGYVCFTGLRAVAFLLPLRTSFCLAFCGISRSTCHDGGNDAARNH